ncbi:MAG: HAD-IA family hydrolase [candidate division Zixibacteria bacterium]|nr:HAD-IA family hydrolase [candidate division Zixibacteria bacterium]NIW40466.1 HAD-IA family hydrolase [candidate division Zixibacteria bacterium]NIX59077.1 HAD-IA family hydrolase [candidate division Zixibacteria bacterium]
MFDFDYTLGDSSEGIIDCMTYAFGKLGLPEPDPEEIKKTIGKSLPDTFEIFTGNSCRKTINEFRKFFRARADEVMADKTYLYESVPKVLEELQDYRLGIVSTKFSYRIRDILRREKIEHFFDVIIGGENVSKNKPDPEGLHLALEKLGTTPEEIVYIGDSQVDAETAKRGGIKFVAVLSGVTVRHQFESYNVWSFMNDLSELPELLSNSIRR